MRTVSALLAAVCLGLTACATETPQRLVDDAALADTSSSSRDDWLAFGRSYDEQRFSPLTQIDDGNVGDLGDTWSGRLPLCDRRCSSICQSGFAIEFPCWPSVQGVLRGWSNGSSV